MNNIYFFTEYESRTFPHEIPSAFYESGFCEKDNSKIKFTVVGILEYELSIYIIFPKGLPLNENLEINHINSNLLIRALQKYLSNTSLSEEEQVWNQSHNSLKLIKTIEWLIEDYKAYDIISFSKKIISINNNGRIDWNKTIHKVLPYYSKNKNIIYPNLYTIKNKTDEFMDVTLIHMWVLADISEKYGQLFNLKFSVVHPQKIFSIDYMIYILKKTLSTLNFDREIQLIQHLILYIEEKLTNSQTTILVTPYFANIWEKMCSLILRDNLSIRNLIPTPYWYFRNQKKQTIQIPDILTEYNGSAFVFDAKYYQIARGTDKLPGWHDLVKQFFYALSLKDKYSIVYNSFLFPGTFNGANIEYLGFARVDDKFLTIDNSPEEEGYFGNILAIGIDVSLVLNSYIQNGNNSLRHEIHMIVIRPN